MAVRQRSGRVAAAAQSSPEAIAEPRATNRVRLSGQDRRSSILAAAMLERSVRHAMQSGRASNAGGIRLLVGSLQRRWLCAAGALIGEQVAPENISAFVEHIGMMMMLARFSARPVIPYSATTHGGSAAPCCSAPGALGSARISCSVIPAHYEP